MSTPRTVAVLGAGTMGRGIAQVAAAQGDTVVLFDTFHGALESARITLDTTFARLVEKGTYTKEEAAGILGRINFTGELLDCRDAALTIEAIVEEIAAKRELFQAVAAVVKKDAVIATNTSSLSVTALAAGCLVPERFLGIHFFNPAPLMKLVEVVPALQTSAHVVERAEAIVAGWKKEVVRVKDSPGFLVNRVARPFYTEAFRILEERIATVPQIDTAMREHGGFKMGPFELIDLIGCDINLAVTRHIFAESAFEPRYKPSITQQRMIDAGWLGKKTGRGFYRYDAEAGPSSEARLSPEAAREVCDRILLMLFNEAVEAVQFGIGTPRDIDRAMRLGVNYPKGLLEWIDGYGPALALERLERLYFEYGEDRYRPSRLLRKMVRSGETFYPSGSMPAA